jgi:hypothetical protein
MFSEFVRALEAACRFHAYVWRPPTSRDIMVQQHQMQRMRGIIDA